MFKCMAQIYISRKQSVVLVLSEVNEESVMCLLSTINQSQMIPSALLKSENLSCLLSSHSWTILSHRPLPYGF